MHLVPTTGSPVLRDVLLHPSIFSSLGSVFDVWLKLCVERLRAYKAPKAARLRTAGWHSQATTR